MTESIAMLMKKIKWHTRYVEAVIHSFGEGKRLKMDRCVKIMFEKYYFGPKNAKVKVQFT
jgi:hypothetical protein